MINVVGKNSRSLRNIERLKFILNQIDVSNPNRLVYRDHHNNIHVDKKYFYTTPPKRDLKYLPHHEWHPQQTIQHKSHIPKLMITSDDLKTAVDLYFLE